MHLSLHNLVFVNQVPPPAILEAVSYEFAVVAAGYEGSVGLLCHWDNHTVWKIDNGNIIEIVLQFLGENRHRLALQLLRAFNLLNFCFLVLIEAAYWLMSQWRQSWRLRLFVTLQQTSNRIYVITQFQIVFLPQDKVVSKTKFVVLIFIWYLLHWSLQCVQYHWPIYISLLLF